MNEKKTLALRLRISGKSYEEISKSLSVAKSTLSNWLSKDKESQKIKNILSSKENKRVAERINKFVAGNKKHWSDRKINIQNDAREKFNSLKNNKLFIAGAMLYWAEGDNKSGNPFRLTNTDPRMIALYIKFLTEALKLSKKDIKIALILYPDLSEKECMNFWSKISGINQDNFYKTQFIKGNHPTKRLSHGICIVNCNNRPMKEKVLVWIDLLSKNI